MQFPENRPFFTVLCMDLLENYQEIHLRKLIQCTNVKTEQTYLTHTHTKIKTIQRMHQHNATETLNVTDLKINLL